MNRRGAKAARPGCHRAAAGLIGACAAYQTALGTYFVAFRPSLLPEDLRFLGTTAARLLADQPRLEQWLNLVLGVLGGQMAALGLLLAALAVRLARGRAMDRHEVVLFALAGILSVALMAGVNFALASNFRWILVVPVLTWSIGIALAAFGSVAVPVKAGEHPHAR